jgi:hypothetical protein
MLMLSSRARVASASSSVNVVRVEAILICYHHQIAFIGDSLARRGSAGRVEYIDAVRGEGRVGGDETHPLLLGLTYKEPVGGVGVVVVELACSERVAGIDGQMQDL